MNAFNQLTRLRAAGWSVAVHNDYRVGDRSYTFWLFTHPSGRWVKGEGATDKDAIDLCMKAARLDEEPAGFEPPKATPIGNMNDLLAQVCAHAPPPDNKYLVGVAGEYVVIGLPMRAARMTDEDALGLAAHIVAMSRGGRARFEEILAAMEPQ